MRTMTKRFQLVVTCEHASNRVPVRYRALFNRSPSVLETHRGYDLGALGLTRRFARHFQVQPHLGEVSRLLIELNRSIGHRSLFSEFSAVLSAAERQTLREKYYDPYRGRVRQNIAQLVSQGQRVCHLSVHSFTPVLDGDVRRADIGFLYDPARSREQAFCRHWLQALKAARGDLQLRCNYPYQGKSDGFTTSLRKEFNGRAYLGIELEVNQRWPGQGGPAWTQLQKQLVAAFAAASC